jgi:carbon monoxide dehydrogenase subunit G
MEDHMELTSEFEVGVPVEQTWAVLTDLHRLTPCVPGARLDEADGEHLRGILDIKVGPIDAQYEGRSAFVELDEDKHQIVLSVTGHDTHGQGDATASITLDLAPRGEGTQVSVMADLAVSGKVAQFGRGVLADVSSDLMQQFVDNLEAEVSGKTSSSVSTSTSAPTTGSVAATAAAERGASDPGVRVVDTSGPAVPSPVAPVADAEVSPPVVTKVLAAAGALVAVVAFGYLLKRRRAGRGR